MKGGFSHRSSDVQLRFTDANGRTDGTLSRLTSSAFAKFGSNLLNTMKIVEEISIQEANVSIRRSHP